MPGWLRALILRDTREGTGPGWHRGVPNPPGGAIPALPRSPQSSGQAVRTDKGTLRDRGGTLTFIADRRNLSDL